MIESARKSKNLSQATVGHAINVSQSYISRIEKGTITHLDSDKIVKLAEVLDLCPFAVFSFITKCRPKCRK